MTKQTLSYATGLEKRHFTALIITLMFSLLGISVCFTLFLVGQQKWSKHQISAPIGAKLTIRYNLTIKNERGDTIRLKDIYNAKNRLMALK